MILENTEYKCFEKCVSEIKKKMVVCCLRVHLVQPGDISGFSNQTTFIQQCNDSHFLFFFSKIINFFFFFFISTYSFNEIANNLVVKVFDWLPLNSFLNVFFLFTLECQFNEQLLQFLVTQIDTELFERVVLENFESVNIQNSDDEFVSWRSAVEARVDVINQPTEQSLVNCL